MADWHTRYRRIIDAYRFKLLEVDQLACRVVDGQMYDAGEAWITNGSDSPPDLDRLMTAKEIADEFGFSAQNVKDWARRHPELITKHREGGRVLFRLRQVLRYQAMKSA